MKKLFLIFFVFTTISFAQSETATELDGLFEKLKKTSNPMSARKIEGKIWKLWTTHPSEESLTNLLAKGSEYMAQNQLTSAHNVFTKAIEHDPNWAEAWNKRATVLYLMGNFELSQNDIDMVLKLEKRHFGALSGQGLVQMKLKNYEKAFKSYESVKKIYPSMRSPKIMIPQIKELIKDQSV